MSPQCAAVSPSSRNPALSNAQSVLNDGGNIYRSGTARQPLESAGSNHLSTASMQYPPSLNPVQESRAAPVRRRCATTQGGRLPQSGMRADRLIFHFPEKALSNATGRPRRAACHDIGLNRMAEIRAGVRSASLSVKTSMAPTGLVEACIFLARLP